MSGDLTSNPLCAPTKEELIQFLTAWEGVGQLQTFTSREKFRKEARYFIQRLGLPEPPNVWQPIETAPKLGKWVLLWWPAITDAAFVGYCVDGVWKAATSGDKWPGIDGPTHWMPLPAGPAVTKNVLHCPHDKDPDDCMHCADRQPDETDDRQWLIRKRGYYYRPDRAGYTSNVADAGRYTEAEAKAEAAIEPSIMQAIHISQAMSEDEVRK